MLFSEAVPETAGHSSFVPSGFTVCRIGSPSLSTKSPSECQKLTTSNPRRKVTLASIEILSPGCSAESHGELLKISMSGLHPRLSGLHPDCPDCTQTVQGWHPGTVVLQTPQVTHIRQVSLRPNDPASALCDLRNTTRPIISTLRGLRQQVCRRWKSTTGPDTRGLRSPQRGPRTSSTTVTCRSR